MSVVLTNQTGSKILGTKLLDSVGIWSICEFCMT